MLPSRVGTDVALPTMREAVAAAVFDGAFVDVTPPAGSALSYLPAVPLETATDTVKTGGG